MSRTIHSGPIASRMKETDGAIFIPAFDFMYDVGTWTLTRDAAGNYKMRKTPAANVSHPSVHLTPYFLNKIGADPNISGGATALDSGHDIRGVQVKEIRVVHNLLNGTTALNAHTAALNRVTYANAAAVVVAATALTGTLPTAANAASQTFVTALTVGTLFTLGGNLANVSDSFEITIDAAAASDYSLYGVYILFNHNIL